MLAATGFVILAVINFTVVAFVTSVITLMKETFQVSNIEANVPVVMFPMVYLAGPLLMWVTRKLGPHKMLILVSLLSSFSALSAIVATNYYGFLFLSILSAVPQALINSNFNTVARYFVSPPYRASYLAFLQVVHLAAYAAGFCMGVLWIQDEQEFKLDFRMFQIVPFLVSLSCLFLYIYLWQKDRSSHYSLARVATDRGLSLRHTCSVNKKFILCWIFAAAIGEGLNNAVALLLEQIFTSQGFSNKEKMIGGVLFFIPAIPVPYLPAYLINNFSFKKSMLIAPLVVMWTTTVFGLLILVPMEKAGLFSILVFYVTLESMIPTFATAGTEQFDSPYEIDVLNNLYCTSTAAGTLIYTLFFATLPDTWFGIMYIIGSLLAAVLMTVAQKELSLFVQDLPL